MAGGQLRRSDQAAGEVPDGARPQGAHRELLQGFGVRHGRSARHHGRGHQPHEYLHGGHGHPGAGQLPEEVFRRRDDKGGHRSRLPQQQPSVRRARGRHFRFERLQGLSVRRFAPHPGAQLRHPRAEVPQRRGGDRFPQPQGVQRLQGLLERRRAGDPSPRQEHHRGGGQDYLGGPDSLRQE